MQLETSTLKSRSIVIIINLIVLLAHHRRLKDMYDESIQTVGALDPLPKTLADKIQDDVREINRFSIYLKDEDLKSLQAELDSGTHVLDLMDSLIGQYRKEGVAPLITPLIMGAPRPSR
jgi:hypothetical protein